MSAPDSDSSYALGGAAAAAALPTLAHLDYEVHQLPGHRRNIREMVSQAVKDRTLHLASEDSTNPLQKKMRLGDVVQQSHKGQNWQDLIKAPRSANFTSFSLMGSGSAFPHVALSSDAGRAIHLGDADKITPHGQLLNNLVYRIRNKGQAPAAKPNTAFRQVKDVRAALARRSDDAFMAAFPDDANVSVVRRLHGAANLNQDALAARMLEQAKTPYSKLRAVLAGVQRMVLPGGEHVPGLGALKGLGTFCSDGACSAIGGGLKLPRGAVSMPHSLASAANSDLVGIGLNRAALAGATKGTRGTARLASAATNTLNSSLRSASNLRRLGAGGLIAALGSGGALLGSQFGASKPEQAS